MPAPHGNRNNNGPRHNPNYQGNNPNNNQNNNRNQNQNQGGFNNNQNQGGFNSNQNNQNQNQGGFNNNQNQGGFNQNQNQNQNQGGFNNQNQNRQYGGNNQNQNPQNPQNNQNNQNRQQNQFNAQARPPQQQNKKNGVAVHIQGHDPNWNFKMFQSAVNGVFSARWLWNDFKPGQQVVEIGVQRHEAQRMAQSLNGCQVNGFTLQAMILNSESNQPLSTLLQSFSTQHGQGLILDLSSLPQRLQTANVRFSWTDKGNFNEMNSFFLQHGPKFVAINLSGNNLDLDTSPQNNQASGYSLRRLLQQCTKLTHVSLSNAKCDRVENLTSVLSGVKHTITTVDLDDSILMTIWNTVQQPLSNNQQPDMNFILMSVHQWLIQQFPLLTHVNSTPIKPFIQLIPQRALTFPFQSQSLFIHPALNTTLPNASQNIPTQFVTSFLHCFDNSRGDLQGIYDASSAFSLSLSNDLSDPNQTQLNPWISNTAALRNLDSSFGSSSLIQGAQSIMQIFSQFPPTIHDMDSLSCDAIPIMGSEFLIQITGRLQQPDQNGNGAVSRYYSRTFVVLCNVNSGSFLVKNDQLFLHSVIKSDSGH